MKKILQIIKKLRYDDLLVHTGLLIYLEQEDENTHDKKVLRSKISRRQHEKWKQTVSFLFFHKTVW